MWWLAFWDFLACFYLAFLILLSLLFLSLSDLIPFLEISPHCGSCLRKEPFLVRFSSMGPKLRSRLLQPLQTFLFQVPVLSCCGRGQNPSQFPLLLSHWPSTLRFVKHPIAAPWFFHTETHNTPVIWLLVFLLPLAFEGYHLVLGFCFVSCLFCVFTETLEKIPELCLPLMPPSFQNFLMFPFIGIAKVNIL